MTPNFRAFLFVLAILVALAAPALGFARDLERVTSSDGKASITLTDLRDGCEWNEKALQARYDGPTYAGPVGVVLGCYVRAGGVIHAVFEDGDQYQLPESAFKPVGL